MLIVYVYDADTGVVAIATTKDARSSTAATTTP
jgi:hypothetical protein